MWISRNVISTFGSKTVIKLKFNLSSVHINYRMGNKH